MRAMSAADVAYRRQMLGSKVMKISVRPRFNAETVLLMWHQRSHYQRLQVEERA